MANKDHLELLKQGVEVWNQWRREYPDIQPNLASADLSGSDLRGIDLRRVYLSETNLGGAKLSEANLSRAYCRRANLSGADVHKGSLIETNLSRARLDKIELNGADLTLANLSEANLTAADLTLVNLIGANLSGANLDLTNLSQTNMFRTVFGVVDLSMIMGFDTVNHAGPSTVGIDTIIRSRGNIPEVFLLGAGVPDNFITYSRSLIAHPINYYRCFISYSSKDKMFANRLYANLQDQGVRCWFAPEDLKIGDKIRSRIDEAIHLQDKLLLLLSEHALASTWVEDEVEAALEKEQRQQREVLFPVRLDESVMQTTQAWAAKLRRTRHIDDFTNWTDPQAYQQAFERLLRDLKAEVVQDGKGTP